MDKDAELLADLAEIRASMAIEGYDLSDRQMAYVFKRSKESEVPQRIAELRARADNEGLDFTALVDEYIKELRLKRAN